MNCHEVLELLSAYFDGELPREREASVAAHLQGCPQCAAELTGFERVSQLAAERDPPPPPADLFDRVEQRLAEEAPASAEASSIDRGERTRRTRRTVALAAVAATVLLAVGLGRVAYRVVNPHDGHPGHGEMAAAFEKYLQQFESDPEAAQRLLLSTYPSSPADPAGTVRQVGYRPLVADGLPPGYTLDSTHVMKMPCCTCVQSVCRRADGTALAIFEHSDPEPSELGGRPGTMTMCRDKECCLIQLDDRLAATWSEGSRRVTLIGARDMAELDRLVASMGDRRAAP